MLIITVTRIITREPEREVKQFPDERNRYGQGMQILLDMHYLLKSNTYYNCSNEFMDKFLKLCGLIVPNFYPCFRYVGLPAITYRNRDFLFLHFNGIDYFEYCMNLLREACENNINVHFKIVGRDYEIHDRDFSETHPALNRKKALAMYHGSIGKNLVHYIEMPELPDVLKRITSKSEFDDIDKQLAKSQHSHSTADVELLEGRVEYLQNKTEYESEARRLIEKLDLLNKADNVDKLAELASILKDANKWVIKASELDHSIKNSPDLSAIIKDESGLSNIKNKKNNLTKCKYEVPDLLEKIKLTFRKAHKKQNEIFSKVRYAPEYYERFHVLGITDFGELQTKIFEGEWRYILDIKGFNERPGIIESPGHPVCRDFIKFVQAFFVKYQAVFGSFDRVKICRYEPCSKLFHVGRLGKEFCSNTCRAGHNTESEPKEVYRHCRERQNAWLRYWLDHKGITIAPDHVKKVIVWRA